MAAMVLNWLAKLNFFKKVSYKIYIKKIGTLSMEMHMCGTE